MKHFKTCKSLFLCLLGAFALSNCTDKDEIIDPSESETGDISTTDEADYKYVGKATKGFKAEEWYPGGELGTTHREHLGEQLRDRDGSNHARRPVQRLQERRTAF